MPLDEATFSKDLTNCITDARPVKVRHRGRELNAWQVTADDMLQVVDGGISDDMTTSLILNFDELKGILPLAMDDVHVLINKEWVRFQIRSVPDRFHAGISPIYQIYLQSPHKGVT